MFGVAACGGGERTFSQAGSGGAGGSVASGSSSSATASSSTGAATPLEQGASCFVSAQCESGSCVDGVCCESACDSSCVACAALLTGAPDGTCAPANAGADPHNDCSADSPLTCGQDGTCDGEGACAKYVLGTECAPSVCKPATNLKTPVGVCDGSGTCVRPSEVNCANGCNDDETGCAEDCTADSCPLDMICDQASGSCAPKSANGQSCSSASTCVSGLCVDGVCCDTPCEGLCQACTADKRGFGEDGTCGSIKSGLDPEGECTATAPDTCGDDGTCNGAGACRKYGKTTLCGAPSHCDGSYYNAAETCNGLGQCLVAKSVNCGLDGCTPSGCGAAR